ncbi:MAG: hypothetical protein LBD28_00400 [Tannerellaceae bacterium]|jgi:hypothetical protein|nr:hypothetical protein [Tannerellaceae bacterium]
MKIRNMILALATVASLAGCSGKKTGSETDRQFAEAVSKAVERQMQQYPESRIKDLYKSFFQDKFGPGHLIADTTGAGAYLRRELSDCACTDGEAFEPTGWEGNFVRVNLSVLKKNLVPYDLFLSAFFRSAQNINAPSLEEWKEEWNAIAEIICAKHPSLPDYESDLSEINDNLAKGIYIGHHSRVYEETYAPHYRLIRKEIFEEEIQALLF